MRDLSSGSSLVEYNNTNVTLSSSSSSSSSAPLDVTPKKRTREEAAECTPLKASPSKQQRSVFSTFNQTSSSPSSSNTHAVHDNEENEPPTKRVRVMDPTAIISSSPRSPKSSAFHINTNTSSSITSPLATSKTSRGNDVTSTPSASSSTSVEETPRTRRQKLMSLFSPVFTYFKKKLRETLDEKQERQLLDQASLLLDTQDDLTVQDLESFVAMCEEQQPLRDSDGLSAPALRGVRLFEESELEAELLTEDEDDCDDDDDDFLLRATADIDEKIRDVPELKKKTIVDENDLSGFEYNCDLPPADDDFDPYLFIKFLPSLPSDILRRRLLPAQRKSEQKPTLVLDLDETLVHCSTEPMDTYDFLVHIQFNGATFPIWGRIRPHCEEFLREAAKSFELVIFTASQQIYADVVLDHIDPNRHISSRLFRDSCVYVEGNFLKELSCLNRDLAHTVIVDNSITAFGYQPDNGIPIVSWYEDPNDHELRYLLPILDRLAHAKDVRPIVRQTFKLQKAVSDASEGVELVDLDSSLF